MLSERAKGEWGPHVFLVFREARVSVTWIVSCAKLPSTFKTAGPTSRKLCQLILECPIDLVYHMLSGVG